MEKHLVATAAVIYLAGGCFWGTQRLFTSLPGVIGTQTGYANSAVPSPSYKQVCAGATDAAEAVKVTYDADVISLPEILDFYWKSVDPYSLNRQGGDRARSTARAFIIPTLCRGRWPRISSVASRWRPTARL